MDHANTSLEIRSESLYDRVRGPTQRLPLNLNPNADTQLGLHSQIDLPSMSVCIGVLPQQTLPW